MHRITTFLLLLTLQAHAQQVFNVGLKEGISTSQVSGDNYAGYDKFGFVGGAFMNAMIAKNWSAGFEINFTQKGSKHKSDYDKGDYTNYFLQLNYVEVPILFKYYIGFANIEFGPGYSFLVKKTELINLNGIDFYGTKPFNADEINFNLGLNYTFTSHFGFNLRYTNSIIPIRKNTPKASKFYDGGQLNSVISLCLFYEFGKDGSIWKK